MDRQFGLEFVDAPLGRCEFVAFSRSQTGDESAVDLLLTPPGVDRLITDAQVAGQIDDLAPGVEKIDDSTTKLRRVTPSSHCCLLWWTAT